MLSIKGGSKTSQISKVTHISRSRNRDKWDDERTHTRQDGISAHRLARYLFTRGGSMLLTNRVPLPHSWAQGADHNHHQHVLESAQSGTERQAASQYMNGLGWIPSDTSSTTCDSKCVACQALAPQGQAIPPQSSRQARKEVITAETPSGAYLQVIPPLLAFEQ